MRRRIVSWLLLVLGWCLAAGAWAEHPHPAAPLALATADDHALTARLEYLEDASGALTLDEVRQPALAPRFAARPGFSMGFTSSTIWARVRLQQPADRSNEWLLELGYPPMDHVELFAPRADGSYERLVAGDRNPADARAVPHRNYVLPLALPPGESELYLRLRTVGTMVVPLHLWRPHALWQSDQLAYALLALYFGLAGGLALYNLLLFAAVRDVAYLIYVGFVLSLATAQAALNGMGRQFLWPQAQWWTAAAPNLAMAVAIVFGLLFVRSFLGTRQTQPRMDRALLVLVGAWLVTALSADVLLPYAVSGRMINLLAAPSVVVPYLAGYFAWRRGQTGARAYLAACTGVLVGAVALLLHDQGVLPANPITANAMLIGSALEMLLLSFALASRINVARRFKEQARLRIAAEHALVESLGEAQRQLRTALQEREGLLENALVGIAFVSPQGRVTWTNRALQEMFGTSKREARSLERFFASREQYQEVTQEAAAQLARGAVYQRDVELQRADGVRLWVRLSCRAVRECDQTQGTAWVLLDISREKALEARLAQLGPQPAARSAVRELQAPAAGSMPPDLEDVLPAPGG